MLDIPDEFIKNMQNYVPRYVDANHTIKINATYLF